MDGNGREDMNDCGKKIENGMKGLKMEEGVTGGKGPLDEKKHCFWAVGWKIEGSLMQMHAIHKWPRRLEYLDFVGIFR